MVDVPAANLTPEQFANLLNPTPATAQIPQPQIVAGAAGPAQPQQMILLDRNMAQIIKTKPLTDSARPAEIQSWSEALISVYQLQQLDRLNTQLALVYMKSHLDTALSAILSCFMENKPLYLDEHDNYLNYVQTPLAQRNEQSMVRIVYKHFVMQWSKLKLMLNFWSIRQKNGESYPDYAARVKTEFAMVNEFANREEFLGFKLIEGAKIGRAHV